MFELRPNEKFEPSKDVKNLWTYTRKSSFNAAGIKLPGLFITKGFDIDAAAFVAVIFLELWGTVQHRVFNRTLQCGRFIQCFGISSHRRAFSYRCGASGSTSPARWSRMQVQKL